MGVFEKRCRSVQFTKVDLQLMVVGNTKSRSVSDCGSWALAVCAGVSEEGATVLPVASIPAEGVVCQVHAPGAAVCSLVC